MIQFAWPWIFLFLPLPWFVRYLMPKARHSDVAALKTPFFEEMLEIESGSSFSGHKNSLGRHLFAILIWILIVLASTRPQWLGEPISLPVSGRDLLLAVDLSQSMEVPDLTLNGEEADRLSVVKSVMEQFIDRRKGDRIGLILFGEKAYLQTPLTFDRTTIKIMLRETVIGLAGKSTAIGDAIGLAVKRLRERPQENRVLILITDGANTSGEVEPLKAAELAMKSGVRIHTIGVGADEMLIRGFFGSRRINPSSDLDEKTLKAIAQMTGGKYFRARDTEGLEAIYRLLDKLEPVEVDPETFRPMKALYPWPLGAAFLLFSFLFLARLFSLPEKLQEKKKQPSMEYPL